MTEELLEVLNKHNFSFVRGSGVPSVYWEKKVGGIYLLLEDNYEDRGLLYYWEGGYKNTESVFNREPIYTKTVSVLGQEHLECLIKALQEDQ